MKLNKNFLIFLYGQKFKSVENHSKMNNGYLSESMVGIGIPHHHTSPGLHHANNNSFITNIHHGNNITSTPSQMNTHIQITKCSTNFESSKLPLTNHLENQPSLYNNDRQSSCNNQIILPTKPCIEPIDRNNFFQFNSSNQLGK